jgi:hypothetical protein
MEINSEMLSTVPVSVLEAAPTQDTPCVPDNYTFNKRSSGIQKVVINQKRYKAGYIVKNEAWKLFNDNITPPCFIKAAYNLRGEYIGDPKRARFLMVKMGIKPTKADKKHCVCSIGYCKKQRKWYGWSHRAMVGFGIGDKLFEENYREHAPEEKRDLIPFNKHGTVIIRTLKQAKQSAINFAASVS